MKVKQILILSALAVLAASTGSANNPDLDTEGITLNVDSWPWEWEFALRGTCYFGFTLSRQPQPKNEWEYNGFETEELSEGADGNDDEDWLNRPGGPAADTSKVGKFTKTFRARMEFYKNTIVYAYTPGTTVQYTVSAD